MQNPHRSSHQIWIQRMPGMFREEFSVRRKQRRIEELQDPWKIDFRILRVGVIAMDQQGHRGQQKQTGDSKEPVGADSHAVVGRPGADVLHLLVATAYTARIRIKGSIWRRK